MAAAAVFKQMLNYSVDLLVISLWLWQANNSLSRVESAVENLSGHDDMADGCVEVAAKIYL